MNIPFEKRFTLRYYDDDSPQFQLEENGSPVSETLANETIVFYIRNDNTNFTNIEKDVAAEGWVVNETLKIFKVVIDTETYSMLSEYGLYTGRIEWKDRKLILVSFTIDVEPQAMWSL